MSGALALAPADLDRDGWTEAVARAERDRAFLARLRREGKVRRADGAYERNHPDVARPFVADIEARAFPPKNLAIVPKSKRRRR